MYVLRLIPTNIYWVPLCARLHYVVEEFDLASFLKKEKIQPSYLTAIEKVYLLKQYIKRFLSSKAQQLLTTSHISEFCFPYQQQTFKKSSLHFTQNIILRDILLKKKQSKEKLYKANSII